MKPFLKRIGILLLIFALFATTASAQIIKELPQKGELENFTANVTTGSHFTTTATLEAVSKHPTWPHDIWEDQKDNLYISFYYSNTSAPLGYTSVYFYDDGKKVPKLCNINYTLVDPYPGLEIKNSTAPVNNTTAPDCGILNNTSTENTTVLNNTTEPIKNPSKISMYLENGTSGDSVNIDANLQSQPSRGTLDKFKEMIDNAIDAILGGY